MLGRKSSVADSPSDGDTDPGQAAGKGRPTPKRIDARKARRKAAPKTRKEASAMARDKSREERRVARQALITGDERHLPARDAGPEKRLARDVIDSRFTYGQVFFALIFIVFALSLIPNIQLKHIANFAALFSLTLMVVDGGMNGRRAKMAVLAKYGSDNIRGISSYAFMRALLPRRFRRPPPKVKRGDRVG
jgi:hypothetical protein